MKLVSRVAMLGVASAIMTTTLGPAADRPSRAAADGLPLPPPSIAIHNSNIWG
ncbi:hypothetical protein [Nocardia aurea]|uniref:hypothetical protein n=1 Tax=Nocardia aurea TaxID=2144174 RepID=UPI0013004D30|nr:hypothetical protein [Nocardia aurea]